MILYIYHFVSFSCIGDIEIASFRSYKPLYSYETFILGHKNLLFSSEPYVLRQYNILHNQIEHISKHYYDCTHILQNINATSITYWICQVHIKKHKCKFITYLIVWFNKYVIEYKYIYQLNRTNFPGCALYPKGCVYSFISLLSNQTSLLNSFTYQPHNDAIGSYDNVFNYCAHSCRRCKASCYWLQYHTHSW